MKRNVQLLGRSLFLGITTVITILILSAQAQIVPSFPQLVITKPNAPPSALSGYTPRQEHVAIDPSNYGQRVTRDVQGHPVHNDLIVVMHETVGTASSALNLFLAHHAQDADQASYHSLIRRDGSIVYLVPPEMRAFGAGNSVFNGPSGSETVRINPALPSSVNNFAYHTSLESPSDGRGNQRNHSGYTEAQYRSLAWIVAQTNVPEDRITTHRAVDRSGTRLDPRSFDNEQFLTVLHSFRP
jgi:N-acetyl-anhydromuramyl-L-alanine amidase AmpD